MGGGGSNAVAVLSMPVGLAWLSIAPACAHIRAEPRALIGDLLPDTHPPSLCCQKGVHGRFMAIDEHPSSALLARAFALPQRSFPLGVEVYFCLTFPPQKVGFKCVCGGGGGGSGGGSQPKTHWGMRYLDKIMIVQGAGPTIQPLGVGCANFSCIRACVVLT